MCFDVLVFFGFIGFSFCFSGGKRLVCRVTGPWRNPPLNHATHLKYFLEGTENRAPEERKGALPPVPHRNTAEGRRPGCFAFTSTHEGLSRGERSWLLAPCFQRGFRRGDFFKRRNLPQRHVRLGAQRGACSQGAAIGRESERQATAGERLQRRHFLLRCDVPELYLAVETAGRERLAIRREGDARTRATCPLSVALRFPEGISQSRAVLSSLAVASSLPSGENANANVRPLCPSSSRSRLPSLTSQMQTCGLSSVVFRTRQQPAIRRESEAEQLLSPGLESSDFAVRFSVP